MSFYNILKEDINKVLKYNILKKKYKKEIYNMFQVSEPPKDKFGDVSTNAAFLLSKFLKTNPKNFADILIKELKKLSYIEDAKAFKNEYRATLDGLGLDESQKDAIIAEANYAFKLNMDMFNEIQGSASKSLLKIIWSAIRGK